MRRHFAAEAWPPVSCEQDFVSLAHPRGGQGWPVVFDAPEPGAEEGRTEEGRATGGHRRVELHPGHVVLHRRLGGLSLHRLVELGDYRGLALTLLHPEGDDEGVAVVLVHDEPGLSVTLYSAPHADDVVAEWRFWAALLGLPMLVSDAMGVLDQAYPTLGRLVIGAVGLRRRRRRGLRHRRPAVFQRRAAGRPMASPSVHRGERELSARD